MSQYVVVADPRECIILVREASVIEDSAMRQDLAGHMAEAIELYQQAAVKLCRAADACPEDRPDGKLLRQHAEEINARIGYLECVETAPRAIPLEEHIHTVQFALGLPVSPSETSRDMASKESQVRSAAAAISGVTGLLMLGPITGVTLGMATALAATREDQAGSAARKVGDIGVQLFDRAKRLNQRHKISRRVASAGYSALENTTAQAWQGISLAGVAFASLASKARA